MSKTEATPTIKNSERKDRSIRLWGGGCAVPCIPVSRRPGRRDCHVRAEKPTHCLRSLMRMRGFLAGRARTAGARTRACMCLELDCFGY